MFNFCLLCGTAKVLGTNKKVKVSFKKVVPKKLYILLKECLNIQSLSEPNDLNKLQVTNGEKIKRKLKTSLKNI